MLNKYEIQVHPNSALARCAASESGLGADWPGARRGGRATAGLLFLCAPVLSSRGRDFAAAVYARERSY